jgi:hypothetical protein
MVTGVQSMHPSVDERGGRSMSVAGRSWVVVHVLCDGQSLFVSDDWGGHSMSVAGCLWAVMHVV